MNISYESIVHNTSSLMRRNSTDICSVLHALLLQHTTYLSGELHCVMLFPDCLVQEWQANQALQPLRDQVHC